MKTTLGILTEEGRTRLKNGIRRSCVYAMVMIVLAGVGGYAIHRYWVSANLTTLQRVYAPRLKDFIDEIYLPWTKANKRSCRDDVWRSGVLIEYFGKQRMDEIAPFQIERFKHERRAGLTWRGTQRTPASVNRELEVLSRIFTIAIDNGMNIQNPCRKVKLLRTDNQRNRYLSEEEETRLMAILVGRRAHLRPVVILALHTGMRRGEILSLRWNQIDFVRGLILVQRTKTGRDSDHPNELDG